MRNESETIRLSEVEEIQLVLQFQKVKKSFYSQYNDLAKSEDGYSFLIIA